MQRSVPKQKRKQRLKNKAQKRRKLDVNDDKSNQELSDENSSSDNGDEINWKKLETELEENAMKANLTAVNVKSILHHILADRRVIEYATTAADGNTFNDVLNETKLTRSKAKLLGHQPLPIPASEKKPKFLDLEFPDGSSSDEEYQPVDEEDNTSQASDEDLSTFSDAFSDMHSPYVGTPCSSVGTPRSSVTDINETVTEESASTPQLEKPEVLSQTKESEVSDSIKKELFKVPKVPEKPASEEEDLIATRTRSQFPMPNVDVQELEAMFQPPDSAALDFSVSNFDDPDEVIWKNWLSDFLKPMKALNDVPDEDINDEDFNYMEAAASEDTEVETEELRDDKATRVTQKELQELFNELLLGFDDPGNQDICYEWEADEEKIPNKEVVSSLPDEFSDLEITFEQRQQIAAQMQQHVQLLAQSYMLCCTHSSLHGEIKQCKQYIEELAKFHDKALENSVLGDPQADSERLFCTPGIVDAYNIVSSLNGASLPTAKPTKATNKFQHNPINDTIAHMISTNSYFATYIELLPQQGMIPNRQDKSMTWRGPKVNRVVFSNTEDNLLALGLLQFKGKDKLQEISQHLLPTKSPRQLGIRIKNLCSNKPQNIGNPVSFVRKEGCYPVLSDKLNITVPREISTSPLFKLPRGVWKGKIAPSWFLKIHKKIQMEEAQKEYETKHKLYSVAAKIDVRTPSHNTSSCTSLQSTPPITVPASLSVCPASVPPVPLELDQCSKLFSSTPVNESTKLLSCHTDSMLEVKPKRNFVSSHAGPIGKVLTAESPKRVNRSLSYSGLQSKEKNSLYRQEDIKLNQDLSQLNHGNNISKTLQESQAPFMSSSICGTVTNSLLPAENKRSAKKTDKAATPNKNNSNDGFIMTTDQLLKDLPLVSPRKCKQFFCSPSKPLLETSYSEVKQILKTPRKNESDVDGKMSTLLLTPTSALKEDIRTVESGEDSLETSAQHVLSLLRNPATIKSEPVEVTAEITDNMEMGDAEKINKRSNVNNENCQNDVELVGSVNRRADSCISNFVNNDPALKIETTTHVNSTAPRPTENGDFLLSTETVPTSFSCVSTPAGSDNEEEKYVGDETHVECSSANNIADIQRNVSEDRNCRRQKNIRKKKQVKRNVFNYQESLLKKAQEFSNIYFRQVMESLVNEPELSAEFFKLMETAQEEQWSNLALYYKVEKMFSHHQELVNHFAGFLKQHEARHVGKFLYWLMFDQVIHFHLACEHYFFNVPGMYAKIMQRIERALEREADSKKVVDMVSPLFRGNQNLINQFIRLFPDLPPPMCDDDDFEVIDFAAVSSGAKEIDDFEEISYHAHDSDHYSSSAQEESCFVKKTYSTFSRKKSNTDIAACKLRQLATKRKKKMSALKDFKRAVNKSDETEETGTNEAVLDSVVVSSNLHYEKQEGDDMDVETEEEGEIENTDLNSANETNDIMASTDFHVKLSLEKDEVPFQATLTAGQTVPLTPFPVSEALSTSTAMPAVIPTSRSLTTILPIPWIAPVSPTTVSDSLTVSQVSRTVSAISPTVPIVLQTTCSTSTMSPAVCDEPTVTPVSVDLPPSRLLSTASVALRTISPISSAQCSAPAVAVSLLSPSTCAALSTSHSTIYTGSPPQCAVPTAAPILNEMSKDLLCTTSNVLTSVLNTESCDSTKRNVFTCVREMHPDIATSKETDSEKLDNAGCNNNKLSLFGEGIQLAKAETGSGVDRDEVTQEFNEREKLNAQKNYTNALKSEEEVIHSNLTFPEAIESHPLKTSSDEIVACVDMITEGKANVEEVPQKEPFDVATSVKEKVLPQTSGLKENSELEIASKEEITTSIDTETACSLDVDFRVVASRKKTYDSASIIEISSDTQSCMNASSDVAGHDVDSEVEHIMKTPIPNTFNSTPKHFSPAIDDAGLLQSENAHLDFPKSFQKRSEKNELETSQMHVKSLCMFSEVSNKFKEAGNCGETFISGEDLTFPHLSNLTACTTMNDKSTDNLQEEFTSRMPASSTQGVTTKDMISVISDGDQELTFNSASNMMTTTSVNNHSVQPTDQELTFSSTSNVDNTTVVAVDKNETEHNTSFVGLNNSKCQTNADTDSETSVTSVTRAALSFRGKISPRKRRLTKEDIITLETKETITEEEFLARTNDFASMSLRTKRTLSDTKKVTTFDVTTVTSSACKEVNYLEKIETNSSADTNKSSADTNNSSVDTNNSSADTNNSYGMVKSKETKAEVSRSFNEPSCVLPVTSENMPSAENESLCSKQNLFEAHGIVQSVPQPDVSTDHVTTNTAKKTLAATLNIIKPTSVECNDRDEKSTLLHSQTSSTTLEQIDDSETSLTVVTWTIEKDRDLLTAMQTHKGHVARAVEEIFEKFERKCTQKQIKDRIDLLLHSYVDGETTGDEEMDDDDDDDEDDESSSN